MLERILVCLMVVILTVPVGSQALFLQQSDPQSNQNPSLLHPEEVEATLIRDQWGIPHIWADDAYSLFYVNGYVQAQDRLAALEILRHVGKGEIAKLIGPPGLEMDLIARRELYTHEERVEALQALPPEWQYAFQAFTDGVNTWIDEVRTDPTKLPVEYPALVVLPEDWEPTDTVAIAQYLLDIFGRGSGGQEVQNAQLLMHLVDTLGEEQGARAFDDLVWGVRNETYTTIKPGDTQTPWQTLDAEFPKDLSQSDSLLEDQWVATHAAVTAKDVDDADPLLGDLLEGLGLPLKMGSNAQLLDARFSQNDKPLLFGGPQMGYFTPAIPYEVGLHGAGFEAVGMGVTGAPGVIIGRSADAAWTITSGASDQVDMVAERLTGHDTYLIDDVEHTMDCRTETHLVRPGPPDFIPDANPDWRPPDFDIVEQEICRTIHGPVLARTPDGEYAFSSQRSYRGDEVRSGTLWLQVGTVKNVTEFQDLFEDFRFSFNFNYADQQGNLLFMHTGAQPLRDERLDPRLPRPGWDSSTAWNGTLTGSDLPHVLNPESGYTVNWNNNPAPGWHSGDARELWGAIHRAELMEQALLAKIDEVGTLTMDDMRAINEYASTHHPYAPALFDTWHQAASELEDDSAQVVAELDAWKESGFDYADRDGDGFHDHAAFRLWELWMEALIREMFADELEGFVRMPHWEPSTGGDPHAADHGDHTNKFNVLVDIFNGDTHYDWCNNVTDPMGTQDCADVARVALAEAVAGDWQEPLAQRMSAFEALGAGPSYQIPMTNRPTFQHFHDWGLEEGDQRSRNVLPPGQVSHMNAVDFLLLQGETEGLPFGQTPEHLEDQLPLYLDFEDKPLLFTSADLQMYEKSRTEFP